MTEGSLGNTSVRKAINNKFEDLVKDYKADFNDLWSEHFIVADDKRQIFITWDGVPADERAGRLAPYLTALDWILAYSLKLIRAGQAGNANFTVHLIDLTSNQFENSFTSENVPTLLEAMPWVTLYAPLKRGRIAYTELPAPEDVRKGNGWVTKKTLKEAAQDPGLRARLERLADMWQAWLIRSDDHHDVNNTAGPLRLCQTKNDISNASPLQKAFATRLEWVSGNVSQKNILEDLKKHVEKAKTAVGEDIDIVLVDDMHSFGWGKLFEEWCGIGKDDTLTPIEEPNRIVFKDTNAEEARWEKEDFLKRDFGFRFDFTIDSEAGQNSGNNQGPQVVFLDMRLHGNPANRAANERNEKDFFKKLVTLIETWGLNEENNQLAWPSIPQDDLLHAKDWASDLRPDRPLEIHSLLPRVMALRAPHIPIIILSSTRKRSVIEPLKPYGNIFTALEKPNVIGSDDGTLERFRSNWQEAWKHSRMLLQTTQDMFTIETFSKGLQKLINDNVKIANPYVEIYMEESQPEKGPFAVGGVIAVYEDNLQRPWDKFDDALYENGICYYDPLVPPRNKKNITIKSKRDTCDKELKKALDAAEQGGFKPKIFSYSLSVTDKSHPLEKLGDLLFYQPAAKALEILMFETLPIYLGENNFKVSIYVATRSLFEPDSNTRMFLMKRFGYSPSPWDPGKFESVSGHSILPLLSQLYEKRNPDRITIDRCLAVTLKYETPGSGRNPDLATRFYCRECGTYVSTTVMALKEFMIEEGINVGKREPQTGNRDVSGIYNLKIKCKKKTGDHEWIPDYRALHYLADEILRPKKQYSAAVAINELPGFNANNDPDLQTLLEASQLADKDDRVLSLIITLKIFPRLKEITAADVKAIILARLARCVPNLSGDEYLKVARATYKP